MSRGRRGGRRQRRREEQARRAAEAEAAKKANGQSGAGIPAPSDSPTAPSDSPTAPSDLPTAPSDSPSAPSEPPPTPAPEPPPAAPEPADAHPRPMSAREFVARIEARRVHDEHASGDPSSQAGIAAPPTADEPGEEAGSSKLEAGSWSLEAGSSKVEAPRHFTANGAEWIATHAGTGAGGTGRVAHARLEAIRFAPAAEPEEVAAEVLLPHARLNDLYDDELVTLLERGLRSRTGNG